MHGITHPGISYPRIVVLFLFLLEGGITNPGITCFPTKTKVIQFVIMYSELFPHGPLLKLYHFIGMVTVVMIYLPRFPSFHSLRHINLASMFLSLGYTFLVVGACIHAVRKHFDKANVAYDQCPFINYR
ncbi:hypothetical protein P3S68_003548 [Capsicum galapagoense]